MNTRIRGTSPELEQIAKESRLAMTPAEVVMWASLRGRQLGGFKFRVQHPLGRFILDFCCPEKKLVVEIDGDIHRQQRARDEARTSVLNEYGYKVLRFNNDEVLENMDRVLSLILADLKD